MSNRVAPIGHPDAFFINGEWVKPSAPTTIAVIDSGTEEVFATVAEAQRADADRAVAAARQAFDEGPWPRLSHAERAEYLRAVAAELDSRIHSMADCWTTESGVIRSTAQSVVGGLGEAYRYYAQLGETFRFEEQHVPKGGGNVGLLVREPVGVVLAIVPWNSPARLMTYKVAPALIAGCSVIVKPSPEAPCNAYIMAEVCEKVGLPPGVFNFITADREVSEYLVRHSGVDKVTFTGSTAAGQRIGSICGERIARCTLELGGKSAGLILDDYDVGHAARRITANAIYLTGQACSSLTRLIVTRKRHDAFVEALKDEFDRVATGDPFDSAMQMGPLAMRRQRDRVESYIKKGLEQGAQLVTGGRRPPHLSRGFYIEPTVFGRVDNHSIIAREEIFGPVVAVIPADSEEQLVSIANDSPYGLNASVFTGDVDRAYALARRLRTGTVGHNSWRSDFSIAFGGFKQSGIGREGGIEGLLPFLEAKTIVLDAVPGRLN